MGLSSLRVCALCIWLAPISSGLWAVCVWSFYQQLREESEKALLDEDLKLDPSAMEPSVPLDELNAQAV